MGQALGPTNADVVATCSRHDELVAKVDRLIDRAQRALLAQQRPEGYWQTALEANAEMNAEFIIFNRFMELPHVGFRVTMSDLWWWARAPVFALMLLKEKKPVEQVEGRQIVLEFYLQPPHLTKFTTLGVPRVLSLRKLLRGADKALRFYDG